ncbi:AraC family transcriptional regulator [Cognatishimia sp. SS12]|uniref:helix-turn-helix domain-containing protein n=1 Tax=Cognatishimia sp. SS12 TaxID=2979465 RepID=UPI00232B41B2|nr:AraC family transcriptional regulator [Cognatishimia sp. SS12]MDC0738821.1 AraC family transcriptional regulator [Cognatishimia sp. SS12]
MDRITTFLHRFHRQVSLAPAEDADLLITADVAGAPRCILFFPRGQGNGAPVSDAVLWSARVEWAAESNPMCQALPDVVRFDLAEDAEAQALIGVLLTEHTEPRCGGGWVQTRLGDVLLVRLLRDQIQRGSAEPGLISGLSDPRLSRAIVAMHDHPGQNWSSGDLAAEAGLSSSRFNELFAAQLGETPMQYLRRWRLVLARQDLEAGARVDSVARRYAYASPEAFSRAFKKAYDVSPIALRSVAV